MILDDIIKAVDRCSLNELRQLREYIQGREQQMELRSGTVNMDHLMNALEEIRAGVSDEEFADIERAMNG